MSAQTALSRQLRPGAELDFEVNDPRRWHKLACTPAIDLEEWQRRINALVGTTATGKPIVRIVDARTALRFEAGNWRLRYRYFSKRIEGPDGAYFIEFAPPRYLLEERIEPEQYMPSWELVRWSMQQDGQNLDVLGPAPRDGLYRPFRDCVVHAHDCCARYPKLKCWGLFRPPDESDLDYLAACMQAMKSDPNYQNPLEPLTERTLAQIALESSAAMQEAADERLTNWFDFWHGQYSLWGWRAFEDDPTKLRHGKYFFTRRVNGLFTPANH